MANLITGLFESETAAENAVAQLKQMGYSQNEISIIMKDRNEARNLAETTGSRTMEGVGEGAIIGGAIGAAILGILGIAGSVLIPGVGLIAAGGWAAMWAGAGIGGVIGGVIGWLVNIGVPEEIAPYYERALNEGGVVVAVAAHPGQEAMVQQVLQGGSVAYAGPNIPTYVSPTYAARYPDITPPRTYDSVNTSAYNTANTAPEAQRTVNSVAAEQRSDTRTAAEHEREAQRDATRTNPISGTVAATENEVDRIQTGLQNQADKVSTGTQNESDRMRNP
jgi:hypothetical protein